MNALSENKLTNTTWKEKMKNFLKNPIVLGVLFALTAAAISAIPFSIPLVTSAIIGGFSLLSTGCFIYSGFKYIPKVVRYFKEQNEKPLQQYASKEPTSDRTKTASKALTKGFEKSAPMFHALSPSSTVQRDCKMTPDESEKDSTYSPLRTNIEFNKQKMLEGNKNTVNFDLSR